PLVVVRREDGGISVLHNRCGHRGAMVVADASGCVDRFRCPYHAWTFRTDGSLQSVPLMDGYAGTAFDRADPALGMPPVARVDSYRGFIFASLAPDGPPLDEFLGATRDAIDNMIGRAPAGRIEIAGGCFRVRQRNNWKIYLEN